MTVPGKTRRAGGIAPRLTFRMLGTPAPMFPGFDVDISTRIEDSDKPDAVWHRERARKMLQAYPAIKTLMGHTPSTAIWCVLFASAQIAVATAMAEQPIWLLVLVAYVVGSWININLFMLAHECNHGLVFGRPFWDRWLFTLTSLPMFLPAHHAWWIEHHVHHNDLGAKKDFIKRRRTFFLMTRHLTPLLIPYALFMLVMQVVRSTIGLMVYLGSLVLGRTQPSPLALTILADEHLISGYRRHHLSAWAVLFPLAALTLLVTLGLLAGWQSVLYLLLSQTFLTGFLHPLMFGMILSNSHFHGHAHYQPSSSYYGWLNWITFNFGYHTEHHDLMSIPWSRLPRLREIAPEFYDCLSETRSYTALTWQFINARGDVFVQCFDNEEHRNQAMG